MGKSAVILTVIGFVGALATLFAAILEPQIWCSTFGCDSPKAGNNKNAAALKAAVVEYYERVDGEDWSYTYNHLDSQSKGMFTEEEWYLKNQFFADAEELELDSMSVEINGSITDPEVGVTVHRGFEGGTSLTRDTYFVYEDTSWKHRFGPEESGIFMPDASFTNFVEANEGGPFGNTTQEVAVENAVENHYEAIGDREFEDAYGLFSLDFRTAIDQREWVDNEKSFDIVDTTVYAVDVTELSDDEATANAYVRIDDNTGSFLWSLTWSLEKEDGRWTLDENSGEKLDV